MLFLSTFGGQVAIRTLQEIQRLGMVMQVPLMDGPEATQKIRLNELGTGRHLRIIAITANAFGDDRRKCFEAGMDGDVVKPVSAKAIGDEVGRVMSRFTQALPERSKNKRHWTSAWTGRGLSVAGTPNPIFVAFPSRPGMTRLQSVDSIALSRLPKARQLRS
jgi:CheY-like chemotaxis protein